MKSGILLWGSGSQALVVYDHLKLSKRARDVVIFNPSCQSSDRLTNFEFSGLLCRSISELVSVWDDLSSFVVCVGGGFGYARVMTSDSLERFGLDPLSMIQSNSHVHPFAKMGRGNQIMSGATIQTRVRIGNYCIFNTGATVDHESEIEDGVHVMGGAAIAGRVRIERYATVGTNATVLPDLTVGKFAYVGAGATVVHNVPEGGVVLGSPARLSRYQGEAVWYRDSLDELEKSLGR